MKSTFLLSIVFLTIQSCTPKTYENKARYIVRIGETVRIYYSTNSCCYSCFAAEQNLKYIVFIGEETVDSGPEDCAGCDQVYAYVFRANTVGVDTVRLKYSSASMPCETADMPPVEFVVEVQ